MTLQEEKELVVLVQQTKIYVKFAKNSFDLHPNLWYNKKGQDNKYNHKKRSDLDV